MKKIIFVEGVPGAGKTTVVRELLCAAPEAEPLQPVYSSRLIPENLVRSAVKRGRKLTLEEARALYRSRPYDKYREEHRTIWKQFCRENQGQNQIADAGLIQAPLYELFGLYQLSMEKILTHIQGILDIVTEFFQPELLYIQTDAPALCVRSAMKQQREQRKQWITGFCKWLEVAPFPMEKQYTGRAGIEQFVRDRYPIDCYLTENLKIRKEYRFRKML